MKTSIELISEERKEQIEKHGYTVRGDRQKYDDGELITAAQATINGDAGAFPDGWDWSNKYICNKPLRERLIIAGAFYMAENDRAGNDDCTQRINDLAAEIDRITSSLKP